MTWASIIAALLQTFGPLLTEWLKRWLEDRLKGASAALAKPATYGPEPALAALFDAAIAAVPRGAFARRALLRRLRAVAVARAEAIVRNDAPVALTQTEIEDVRDAAGAADAE